MKKLVCALLTLALLLTSFASADMKILTKVGIQQKLNQAFAEKAESVKFHFSTMLFDWFIEDGIDELPLLAWKSGIISYKIGFYYDSSETHEFYLHSLVYADEPLPYAEVRSAEEFTAAIEQMISVRIPCFCLHVPYELWSEVPNSIETERFLCSHGMLSGQLDSNKTIIIFKDLVYADYPYVEAEGIDGFHEAIATLREDGIKEFAIVLDPETYKSFSNDASTEMVINALSDAGIMTLNNFGYIDAYCLVYIDVACWTDESEEQ